MKKNSSVLQTGSASRVRPSTTNTTIRRPNRDIPRKFVAVVHTVAGKMVFHLCRGDLKGKIKLQLQVGDRVRAIFEAQSFQQADSVFNPPEYPDYEPEGFTRYVGLFVAGDHVLEPRCGLATNAADAAAALAMMHHPTEDYLCMALARDFKDLASRFYATDGPLTLELETIDLN